MFRDPGADPCGGAHPATPQVGDVGEHRILRLYFLRLTNGKGAWLLLAAQLDRTHDAHVAHIGHDDPLNCGFYVLFFSGAHHNDGNIAPQYRKGHIQPVRGRARSHSGWQRLTGELTGQATGQAPSQPPGLLPSIAFIAASRSRAELLSAGAPDGWATASLPISGMKREGSHADHSRPCGRFWQ